MMVNYDPSLYEEIQIYYAFIEKENQFSKEFIDFLDQHGPENNRILQHTSGKV